MEVTDWGSTPLHRRMFWASWTWHKLLELAAMARQATPSNPIRKPSCKTTE